MFNPWIRKIPWRRKWQLIPVFLPGKSHGLRSLGRLQSMGLQRVRHNWTTTTTIVSRARGSAYRKIDHHLLSGLPWGGGMLGTRSTTPQRISPRWPMEEAPRRLQGHSFPGQYPGLALGLLLLVPSRTKGSQWGLGGEVRFPGDEIKIYILS